MMPDDCPCPFLAARTLTVGKSSTLPSGPTWEIAHLFPSQGHWSEEEYLALETNRRIEFTHGVLEFLPMPTTSHQFIIAYLYGLLTTFVTARDLGIALFSGVRVKVAKGKFREPDVIYIAKEHADRIDELYWTGADLAMEIVSGSAKDRDRDLTEKRAEYARAKISEYWIVDPREERITGGQTICGPRRVCRRRNSHVRTAARLRRGCLGRIRAEAGPPSPRQTTWQVNGLAKSSGRIRLRGVA
jgi:Uma2 family endonuclease